MIDPEIGFTSSVIRDPTRFVGRTNLIRDCVKAINAPMGLIAVYGKRGVGKSSLLRQVQQMALGDYILAKNAGLTRELPSHPRRFLTVYYACDSMIAGGTELLSRLCNDQDPEEGLLRLVPNEGKELAEFTRSKEANLAADLKVVSWGTKGIESSKFARVVAGDVVQTFRNFISAAVTHQVRKRMNRDALLILLDEFDVLKDKAGLGSLIKSLTAEDIKFGVCGIGRDLSDLVEDHASVERLLEQGAIHVGPMSSAESEAIINTAERLFEYKLRFAPEVKGRIAELSCGYPYLTQLIGKQCVSRANAASVDTVAVALFDEVLEEIRTGRAFPTLEQEYQRAIGQSSERQLLLHLLAEQPEEGRIVSADVGKIFLRRLRRDAADLDIQYMDQLLPRLLEKKYGPVLIGTQERGVYEFVNPVFRLYVRIRSLES